MSPLYVFICAVCAFCALVAIVELYDRVCICVPQAHLSQVFRAACDAICSQFAKVAVLVVFLATVVVALFKPTPLLELWGLPTTYRVFPTLADEQTSYDAGGFTVGRAAEYGCVEIRNAGGVTVACNRHLTCTEWSGVCDGSNCWWDSPPVWSFEVAQVDRDVYHVSVGSQCNSACCDDRGTTLNLVGDR